MLRAEHTKLACSQVEPCLAGAMPSPEHVEQDHALGMQRGMSVVGMEGSSAVLIFDYRILHRGGANHAKAGCQTGLTMYRRIVRYFLPKAHMHASPHTRATWLTSHMHKRMHTHTHMDTWRTTVTHAAHGCLSHAQAGGAHAHARTLARIHDPLTHRCTHTAGGTASGILHALSGRHYGQSQELTIHAAHVGVRACTYTRPPTRATCLPIRPPARLHVHKCGRTCADQHSEACCACTCTQ